MALNSQHPQYMFMHKSWSMMRDMYMGEQCIKEKGREYLPPTKSMQLDGMKDNELGREIYNAYKLRTPFPEYVKEAIENFDGLLHNKPATITLPDAMAPMLERATESGESLMALLRRMNEEQLLEGRLGLLLDFPQDAAPEAMPFIALYCAEAIINWDDAKYDEGERRLNLVVLNESGFKRNKESFEWVTIDKYRVLQLGELDQNESEGNATYQFGVFSNEMGGSADYAPDLMTPAMYRGKTIGKIPFVFCNTKDLLSEVDRPPLMALGNNCLSIYLSEADYRQNLHMQGQDTFVIMGGSSQHKVPSDDPNNTHHEDAPLRTGAGSVIELEAEGDAKYVGVDGKGLQEQRAALEADHKRAATRAGQLVEIGGQKESGEALKTRLGAQTATLNQIALTGALALQTILRIAAEWMGLNPEDVVVTPNLEFANVTMTGKDVVDLTTARVMGAPLSKESMHALLVDRGLTKMTYEDEMAKIAEEDAAMPPPTPGNGSGDE